LYALLANNANQAQLQRNKHPLCCVPVDTKEMSLGNCDNRIKSIKTIPLAISFLLILGTMVNVAYTVDNGNLALAQSLSASNSQRMSSTANDSEGQNDTGSNSISNGRNNNDTKYPLPQHQQQQPPASSTPPKTHEYTLIAENTTLEISPGLRVDAWTYNVTMPGPTLTATEGDRVILHFINKTPLPHTVHLHGDHPSEQDGVFEIVGANGNYTYDFIAKPAGALAYHCHVPPVMQHVRMGLYGAFIVYPKTPLPPAREYVFVAGEYDTQNQLNPLPEYYFYNGYTGQYHLNPLPAMTNETVRIYLANMGLSPAYGMHIHGTLFKAYPSGILENPPLKVQSWELASGNTAILEAKWPWPGKFTFHFHGIPEERGAMGYFNVTNPPANAVDGKDIAINKSIDMDGWQMNLTKTLQKADPFGNVTKAAAEEEEGEESQNNNGNNPDGQANGAKETDAESQKTAQNTSSSSSQPFNAINNNGSKVLILEGATNLGDKAYSPNHLEIKAGSTVTWNNNDNVVHTVTSGTPDNPNAGEAFDSGLTSLMTPSKEFSHKFTDTGEFSYFCRIHPTMVGTIDVVP
jgi:nitrite reductase (NO-forming)